MSTKGTWNVKHTRLILQRLLPSRKAASMVSILLFVWWRQQQIFAYQLLYRAIFLEGITCALQSVNVVKSDLYVACFTPLFKETYVYFIVYTGLS